jgi:hypothetical protein
LELIVVHFALNCCSFGVNCNRTLLYLDYTLIGAAGARELNSGNDYTDDYATDDYSHAGVHARLILEDHVWFKNRWMVAFVCDE